MVNVGIIGLGKMGVSHLSILNANKKVNIVGVADTSSFILKNFEKLTNFKTYDNYQKMIEGANPDAVVISTPSSNHYEIAKYCLIKNNNIFIEKPLTLTYAHSKELVNLSEGKVVTQVGYHNRFISTFQYARSVVKSGSLGRIYNFQAQAHGPAITKPSKSWRAKDIQGGGCLYDYGSHVINLLSFIIGTPDNVDYASFGNIHSSNVDDFVTAHLSYENKTHGYLELNWSDESTRRMTTEITIWGTNGKLHVNSQELHIYLKDDIHELNLKKGWNIKYLTDFKTNIEFFVRGEEYSLQLEYFIDKIITNDFNNINSFKESASTDLIIDKINMFRKENG